MRGKLFIPRKLSVDDSRYLEWNNSQVFVNGVRINQYDMDGNKIGYWEYYHPNGNLHSKGNYVNGLENGYWESYYSDGEIWLRGNFINGLYEKNK